MEITFFKIILKRDYAEWRKFLVWRLLFENLDLILDVLNVILEILKLLLPL